MGFEVSAVNSNAADKKDIKKGLAQKTQETPVSIYDVLKNAESTKTRKVYKEVKKYYKENDLKMDKEHKRPNWFQRNILGKKDNNLYRTKALENKQAEVLENGAGEGDVRNKTYRKLVNAGFLKDAEGNLDVERLAKLYNDRAGEDNYINYSHENSEFRQLRADLNEIGREYGVEFSKKDTKEIIELLGDKEKWYNPAQGARRTIGVGGIGAGAGALITTKVNQAVTAGDIVNVAQNVTKTAAIPVAVAAAGVTFAADMLGQAFRNEKAVSVEITHDNAEAYNKYVDESKASKDGKRVMKELATYFTDEKGALDKDSMNKAMREAAGKDSVLNIDEAQALIYKLATKEEEKPQIVVPQPANLLDLAEIEDEPITIEPVEIASRPYKVVVQNGESLNSLAKKYGVSVDELKALNPVKDFTDDCGEKKFKGFKVGETINLPSTANIDAAKNNKTAAEAIKDYEKSMAAIIKAEKDPCIENDKKVSHAFFEAHKPKN